MGRRGGGGWAWRQGRVPDIGKVLAVRAVGVAARDRVLVERALSGVVAREENVEAHLVGSHERGSALGEVPRAVHVSLGEDPLVPRVGGHWDRDRGEHGGVAVEDLGVPRAVGARDERLDVVEALGVEDGEVGLAPQYLHFGLDEVRLARS